MKLRFILMVLALLLLPSAALAVAPVANFTVTPSTGYAPLTVTIVNVSTGAPTDLNYSFNDGSANGTSGLGFTHTYTTAGTYTIALSANNSDGRSTLTRTVTVSVLPPMTVTPTIGSVYNLKTYSTTSPNVTISSTSGGLYTSVQSSIASGYVLLSMGLVTLGAAAILRYLGYI